MIIKSAKGTIPRRRAGQEHDSGGRGSGSVLRVFLKSATGALLLAAVAAFGAETYTLGPDSQPKPGVPKGTVTQHRFESSHNFPGTVRDYWVYTPANVDESKPLPVMIFQDGSGFARETGAFHAPVVYGMIALLKGHPANAGHLHRSSRYARTERDRRSALQPQLRV